MFVIRVHVKTHTQNPTTSRAEDVISALIFSKSVTMTKQVSFCNAVSILIDPILLYLHVNSTLIFYLLLEFPLYSHVNSTIIFYLLLECPPKCSFITSTIVNSKKVVNTGTLQAPPHHFLSPYTFHCIWFIIFQFLLICDLQDTHFPSNCVL